jgi:hypothetical protein
MLGNVWEWCGDVWQPNHDGAAPDGSARQMVGRVSAADRVIRGGSWDSEARFVRSAFRGSDDPADRDADLGFRCARVQNSDQRSGAFGPGAPADNAERGRPTGPQGAAERVMGVSAGDSTGERSEPVVELATPVSPEETRRKR